MRATLVLQSLWPPALALSEVTLGISPLQHSQTHMVPGDAYSHTSDNDRMNALATGTGACQRNLDYR